MDEFKKSEFSELQQEKRDRMNARLQIWTVFISLVSAFSLAGIQSGKTAYLVSLYPYLAACLARYAGHNESIIDQIKAYLLKIEQEQNFNGYEQYNKASKRRSSGGHKRSLRDAIALTQSLATIFVVHLLTRDSYSAWFIAGYVVLNIAVVFVTMRYLKEK